MVIDGELGHKSPNIGKLVKVGAFIGCLVDIKYDDWWEVNKPMLAFNTTKIIYYQREHNLIRLDDDIELIVSELECQEKYYLKNFDPLKQEVLDLLREGQDEIIEMLDESTREKHEKCAKPNGGFDYDKMSEMWHKGEW